MVESPLVSIIINNYNYGRFIKDAIDSALNQTYENIEVIVVDDGSTDNSVEIINTFGDRIVKVLKENGGQASAFNEGVKASRGTIITFLDSDDMLLPGALERIVVLFTDSEVVTVHWPLMKVDINGRSIGEIVPKHPLPEGNYLNQLIKYGPEPENWGSPGCSPLPSGHAYRRDYLESILPIPENEFAAGADYYIFVLAPIFGTFKSISEPQAVYKIHGNNDTLKPLEVYISRYLTWFERCGNAISRFLHEKEIEVDPDKWPRKSWYHQINTSIQEINQLLPPNASFILIDDNHWMSNDIIAGRHRIPFLENNGQYWGHPADDAAAIAEIKRQMAKGICFIIFAWTAFWWLEYYIDMHNYLQENFRYLEKNDRIIVFKLNSKVD